MAEPIVEPIEAAPAPVEPTAPAEPAAKGKGPALPPELLQLPAIQALIAGQPPALSADIQSFAARPEGQLIQANRDPLIKAGLGFYKSLGGDVGVMFNQFYIHGEEIQAADKAGRLPEVAPPFDTVSLEVGKSGAGHPLLQEGERPKTFRQASMAQSSPPTAAPKAPAKVIGAKARNLNPGSPTSGPSPGAGRLMNQILKPVV